VNASTLMPQSSSSDALFVYYKVDATLHHQVAEKLNHMASEFRKQFPELSLEIMQRPEVSPENMETWMEVYRGKNCIEKSVIDAIATLVLNYDLPSLRRVEVFVPLVSRGK